MTDLVDALGFGLLAGGVAWFAWHSFKPAKGNNGVITASDLYAAASDKKRRDGKRDVLPNGKANNVANNGETK